MTKLQARPFESLLDLPLYAFNLARSTYFSTQGKVFDPFTRRSQMLASSSEDERKWLRQRLLNLLRKDASNIAAGIYPLSVLSPESPLRHLRRLPALVRDLRGIYRNRKEGQPHQFKDEDLLEGLPTYYRRNFHFQTNGYLSRMSAELYDHQVEVLFSGAADAMRRLILPPMRKHFGKTDGRGLVFLDVGAGTGRCSTFVRAAFPKAKIVLCDLSYPYMRVAQERFGDAHGVDFLQSNGEKLPFEQESFDAVYSCFLFHELPGKARENVIQEKARVLKAGGFFGLIDSLQLGDDPPTDNLLKQFPKAFHEPFYSHYLSHPIEKVARRSLKTVQTELSFLSKLITARR